jgi:hypothetical protein
MGEQGIIVTMADIQVVMIVRELCSGFCRVERLLLMCHSPRDYDVKGGHILCDSHQLDSDSDTKTSGTKVIHF